LLGKARSLQIHEAEDESLLATLQPTGFWSTRWEVLDADNRGVGRLQSVASGNAGAAVVACMPTAPAIRSGELITLVYSSESSSAPARFRSSHEEGWSSAQDMGTLQRRGADQLLCFSEELESQPLLKMLLLAAALVATD
jgi:hypothetical protein